MIIVSFMYFEKNTLFSLLHKFFLFFFGYLSFLDFLASFLEEGGGGGTSRISISEFANFDKRVDPISRLAPAERFIDSVA